MCRVLSIVILRNYKIKLIVIFIIVVLIIGVCYLLKKPNSNKLCFLHNESNEKYYLPDIMKFHIKPKLGKSIFFHETSCTDDGFVKLTARQACAIESAAYMNPTWDVFVLFAAPVGFPPPDGKYEKQQIIVKALKTYKNIQFRTVNLWTYAANTPVDQWINNGQIFISKYMNSHTSDFLRYLSLWKWGGTYLDLDVIVKTDFNTIKSNYAGAESENFVAAGIINLDYENFGHEIAEMCLRDFKTNFDGSDWGNNGPGVITRVLKTTCDTNLPLLMTRERCHGFKVFPIKSFYAIGWKNWNYFFNEADLNKTLAMLNDSIIIHVWNKHSSKISIKVGSNVAYGLLAEKYCPKVYSSCGEYF